MRRIKASTLWQAGLVIVLLVSFACQRNRTSSVKSITITGELKGANGEMIRLSELDVKAVNPIDSVLVGQDGQFSFEFNPEGSSFYLLTWAPAQKLVLVADAGDHIRLEGLAGRIVKSARIEGSPASAWLLDFERFSLRDESKADSLARIFLNSRSDPGFAGIRQHLDSAYQEIVGRQRLYMERFIDRHPASLASLLVLNHKFGPHFIFTEEKDAPYFIKVDSGLMAHYPGNKHAVDHHSRVAAMIKKLNQRRTTDSLMMPGMPMPEVQFSNAEGRQVSLSSLKGKVVLVYFWAAMDAQSRRFIRKLIPVYKANRNKGFEVYGVALEPNRALWLNALKLDQPGGIQVNAGGGTGSPEADRLGVKTIPEALLIDRQGRIVARKISPEDLRRKLPGQLQLK